MQTVIYNCKRCKVGKRVEYPIERAKGEFYRLTSEGHHQSPGIWIQASGDGRPTQYGGDIEMGICPDCHRMMEANYLKATLRPEVKCSGICIHARGGTCDCSCGGANHGKGWA